MTIIIKRKHTKDTFFDNRKDCALKRAIREEFGEIVIKEILDGYFFDQFGAQYNFDSSDKTGYSRKSFADLKEGKIKEIKVDILSHHKNKIPVLHQNNIIASINEIPIKTFS